METVEKHWGKRDITKFDQWGRKGQGILVFKGQGILATKHCLLSAPGIKEGGSKNRSKGTSSLSTAPYAIPTEQALLPGPAFYIDSNVNGALWSWVMVWPRFSLK